MDLSTIGISVTKLIKASNYVDIYDMFYHQKIVTVLEEKNRSLALLLSSGKLIRYNPEEPTSKLYVDSIWEQYITCEVLSAILSENYPCIFYLSNNSILYLRSTEGDIHTAQPKHLIASTLTLPQAITSFTYNISKKLVIGLSENNIQILCINKKDELVPFAPFQPSCQKFVCENCVIFSKKMPNILYYLDYLQEPAPDNISFSKESSTYYILKKCTIDNKDINESKVHIVSYESELASYDINSQEIFAFLTVQRYLYILKGNKANGTKIPCDNDLVKVRWSSSSMLLFVLSSTSELFVFDSTLNNLSIHSKGKIHPSLSLSSDGLLKRIQTFQVSENIICSTSTNLIVCKLLDGYLSPISNHLRKGNFIEALGCLESVPTDTDFAHGFYLCWKYVFNNLQTEYVKSLENLWTKNFHSRLPGPLGSHLLVRLGFKLIHAGFFEAAFLLGRKLRNIRLLNDLAYFADSKGFKGIALLAKHERELMDEDYVAPKTELENLVKITGRTMNSADYCLLLNDFEEIMSINRISEALGKGGYLEEKNFWEIDLEAYANALMLEGEGKFREALEIYTQHNLTHEINRVNLILQISSKSISAKENVVGMEESKE
ncbi:hypothetical protein SteCoe_7053 [Stentor coeruleus]|uniref:Uncharacterized protein n=1 Tax=Stentor coeruleus TaxID=5963 RepID=A0A1R2CNF9_9CILI|nr:hypothetical protein SteCoe_7053 [Stentor coeruleus]